MTLRPYQKQAYEAAITWVKKSIDPCVIEAATGAGKSHIIAAIAHHLHDISGGKHILCLAPSAELVEQNRAKYLATGNPASVFSASAGGKCLRHPVVFGTPGTVKNSIGRFGSQFCAVVIDEAHGITPTVKLIVDKLRKQNPNLRVIGTTATPYRLGDGYIFAMDECGKPMGEFCCRNPYFTARVFRITAHELIAQGYLTPPIIGSPNSPSYETLNLQLNSQHKFDSKEIDRAFHGHGRKTSQIVADIVEQSKDRSGVMIFAQTIQHAEEVMASLPPSISGLVTSKTKKTKRRDIISRFKEKKIKYLVNVGTLTTGFDAEHVDVIALLRATESVGLLQQIIGRGTRICNGKNDFLVLDYAENIERHCPDGDIFNPEIRAVSKGEGQGIIEAECEECGTINEFSARKNDDGFDVDKNGYFLDLDGRRIKTDHGPMPAHWGRRCQGMIKSGTTHIQCHGRWTSKKCPQCDADNDIAARRCQDCGAEIIDPNEKLKIEFKQLKRDPTQVQTDIVADWNHRPTVSRSGKECLRVDYTTEYRTFSVWLQPYANSGRLYADYVQFLDATENKTKMPRTVTYLKDPNSGFYRVLDYNRDSDSELYESAG